MEKGKWSLRTLGILAVSKDFPVIGAISPHNHMLLLPDFYSLMKIVENNILPLGIQEVRSQNQNQELQSFMKW